jgi:3-oxoacyl-[acyl-carrier protein] reductase
MKQVLITGFARNIGKSIYSRFLRENYNIIGTYCKDTKKEGMRASYATLSYSSSKAALINLSLSLSNSFPCYKNVRVNIVSPGWVNPDDADGMGMQENAPGRKAALLTSMGRNAQTTEIADVVYFLTTKESSFINGANIVVDGGWLNHNTIYYEEAFGNNIEK